VHTYICAYICAYIHLCIHTFVHTFVHTYICAYICAYIHLCIHSCIHTFVHTSVHTYICAYIHLCIHLCKHTFVHTYICAYIHLCIHLCIRTFVHTSVHTYICAYIHLCIHTFVHTYICAYIHLCIHMCIHTFVHIHLRMHLQVLVSAHQGEPLKHRLGKHRSYVGACTTNTYHKHIHMRNFSCRPSRQTPTGTHFFAHNVYYGIYSWRRHLKIYVYKSVWLRRPHTPTPLGLTSSPTRCAIHWHTLLLPQCVLWHLLVKAASQESPLAHTSSPTMYTRGFGWTPPRPGPHLVPHKMSHGKHSGGGV